VYGVNPYRKDREENPTLGLIMVEGIGFESHIDVFDTGTWMQLHPRLERCYEDNMLIYGNSNYTPLVREGVKWNCVMRRVNWYHPELSFNHHYSIQIKGDTIINEVQYKKCYYIFEDKDEPSNVIPRAFLREDIENQQVFVLFNVDYKTEMGMYSLNYPEFGLLEEQMLYDFKNKKNTSPYWLMKYGSDWSIEVESLGMISLQNQVKEKYRLICFRNDYHYLSVELVEGIGLCLSTQKEGETFAGDLLTPYVDFLLGGDNTLPVFLNLEDAEGNIIYVAQEYNGIESVDSTHKDAVEVGRYDLYGRRLSQPAQGVNIIKMSDGTTRKEMVK
jgi:hypothetical protein